MATLEKGPINYKGMTVYCQMWHGIEGEPSDDDPGYEPRAYLWYEKGGYARADGTRLDWDATYGGGVGAYFETKEDALEWLLSLHTTEKGSEP